MKFGVDTDIRLASISSNLREQQVDTKWCVLIFKVCSNLIDAVLQDFRVLVETTDDTYATCTATQLD